MQTEQIISAQAGRTMEYTITIRVPDVLVSQSHITDMNTFANQVVNQAIEREVQILFDEQDKDEKAFNDAIRSPQFKQKVEKLENALDSLCL